MSLNVVSHYPTINQTGIYLNETLKVNFNKPINPSTVTWDTISVHDTDTYSTAVGSLGVTWSGINGTGYVYQATFTPTTNLLPNTAYTVYVFERPNSIISSDGEEMNTTYSWSFITGTEEYDSITGSGTIPSGTTSSGSTIDLSGIPNYIESTFTSFRVYSTNPKDEEPNVETQLSGVSIVFTGNILTTNISDYISIDETPVLQ